MINRWGHDIRRGYLVSFHTARGEVRAGWVRGFSRVSGYGWRVETSAGSCGVDDVMKVTSAFIRPGSRIEVGTGKPGYRWVQGWEVLNPETGAWSAPVRRAEALAMVRDLKGPTC
jgi:hypothetical protein